MPDLHPQLFISRHKMRSLSPGQWATLMMIAKSPADRDRFAVDVPRVAGRERVTVVTVRRHLRALLGGGDRRQDGDLVEIVGWAEHDENACKERACVEATGRRSGSRRAAWGAEEERLTEVIRRRRNGSCVGKSAAACP